MPPSSIETLSTFSAAWAISLRPTSVEPVKLSLRRRGSAMIGAETELDDEPVITLRTPGRKAALLEDLREREHRQRRLLGRLDHHRAAGGDRRADLAGAHRVREVPRGDEEAGADRLAHHQHPARRRCRRACSSRRSAAPRRRTSGRTRPRRRSRPSTPSPPCPSRASSGARARRRARSAPRRRARGSRCARSATSPPTPACMATAASSARRWRPRGSRRRLSQSASPVDGSSTASVAPPLASRHSPPMKSRFSTASTTVCSCVAMLIRATSVDSRVPSDSDGYPASAVREGLQRDAVVRLAHADLVGGGASDLDALRSRAPCARPPARGRRSSS